MSRRIGMRAVHNRCALLKSTARLLHFEATNLKEIVDTKVESTIFKADNKDVCGIGGASCQRLEQRV